MLVNEVIQREIQVDYPKSKNTESYVGIYDIGDNETCERLINLVDRLWDNQDKVDKNQIYFESLNEHRLPNSLRQDRALFISNPDYNEDVRTFSNWLQTGFELYCQKYEISHALTSNTNKFHQVEPFQNGYSVLHYEAADGDSARRCLTWLMYLNDVEEGGETEFPAYGLRVKPKAGRLVIWPAAFTHYHRGNPPFSRKCYVTGWFYGIEDKGGR